mgnify:CR=1 FL=1
MSPPCQHVALLIKPTVGKVSRPLLGFTPTFGVHMPRYIPVDGSTEHPHRLSKVRAQRSITLQRGEKYQPTLRDALDRNSQPLAGGHLIWTHPERTLTINSQRRTIQRHVWEASNGPIPANHFLLNHCLVPGCIAPDCWLATRYPRWDYHYLHTHNAACVSPKDAECVGNSRDADVGQRLT